MDLSVISLRQPESWCSEYTVSEQWPRTRCGGLVSGPLVLPRLLPASVPPAEKITGSGEQRQGANEDQVTVTQCQEVQGFILDHKGTTVSTVLHIFYNTKKKNQRKDSECLHVREMLSVLSVSRFSLS